MLIEIIMTSDRPSTMNNNLPIYCLLRWVGKTIEFVGANVGDVSFKQKTQSQKKHASFALLTRVLENYDHVAYSNAQG
jgi:hypothetical protein